MQRKSHKAARPMVHREHRAKTRYPTPASPKRWVMPSAMMFSQ
jgi:hypothetical protein